MIDAAITDGVISLMAAIQGFAGIGIWDGEQRQANMLDGGAHYYDTYQCADGHWVAIGAIEPQFYSELAEKLGLPELLAETSESGGAFDSQFDKNRWRVLKPKIAERIRQKSREEWCRILEGSDACFAPVLTLGEAPEHPHNRARQSFLEVEGCVQTAVAPRFSRTPGAVRRPPVAPGADTSEILAELGMDGDAIEHLQTTGVVASAAAEAAAK